MKRTNLTENSWLDECNLPENLNNKENFKKIWDIHPEEHGSFNLWKTYTYP